ncbi:hypothetical protein [Neisseria yangbaofengii]|uniref:hypothetical protein n=1 Tax=Neisseria yangbaofengii TaxID=2709396 RepID=UPI00198128E9|nr:hypothetical protein [Neisseria yangbaofengii]
MVEQNCPYPEMDDKDLDALHLFAEQGGQLAAYCRIIAEEALVKNRSRVGGVVFSGLGIG